ncbi:MAG: zinc-binding protein [Nanoarchaeota archaeon]|nr:zinc-binding protein [Nanoarchaeota archaeon]
MRRKEQEVSSEDELENNDEDEQKEDEDEEEKQERQPAREHRERGEGSEDREMHKIKCSECGKMAEVPFKPEGDRPVYCRDCFMKRRQSGPRRFGGGSGGGRRFPSGGRRY